MTGPEKQSKTTQKEANPEIEKGRKSPETMADAGFETTVIEKKEKKPEIPERKNLLETLKEQKNDEKRKEFLMKLKGRRVYHFITKEDGTREKQYLKLKDENVSKGQKDLTFEIFDLNGRKIGEKTQEIKNIKYRKWEKGEPKQEEIGKSVVFRNDKGESDNRTLGEGVESDIGKQYIFKNEKTGDYKDGQLNADKVVRYEYEDKDGNKKFAYARRTEPMGAKERLSQQETKGTSDAAALLERIENLREQSRKLESVRRYKDALKTDEKIKRLEEKLIEISMEKSEDLKNAEEELRKAEEELESIKNNSIDMGLSLKGFGNVARVARGLIWKIATFGKGKAEAWDKLIEEEKTIREKEKNIAELINKINLLKEEGKKPNDSKNKLEQPSKK